MFRSVLQESYSTLYDRLNRKTYAWLQKNGNALLPGFVTADAVTSFRLSLVFPTLILHSHGHHYLPAVLLTANAALDYVDGAIARWEKTDPIRIATLALRDHNSSLKAHRSRLAVESSVYHQNLKK